MKLRALRSPWDAGLAVVCLLVGLSPRLPAAVAAVLMPAGGIVLLGATAVWYWRRQMSAAADEFARLRGAGLAVQVLWLTVLYDSAAGLLNLPPGLARTLSDLLVAVGGAATAVAVLAAVDLAVQRVRLRPVLVAVGFTLIAVAATRLETTLAFWTLGIAGMLVSLLSPMGWLITLERRQRTAVIAGGLLATVPLIATVGIFALASISPHQVLTDFIKAGAIFSLLYTVMLLIRAAQAVAGATLYERKVKELDAVYDFGLTASTALDREEFHLAVLRSLHRIGAPDVAAVVEPAREGDEALLSVLQLSADEEHVYRHRTRAPWSRFAEHFSDRRPLVVEDHSRSQPDVLRRVWEPRAGSSVAVPVLSPEGEPRAVLVAGRHVPAAFPAAEVRSLSGFASQVGLAMEHARLLVELVESERRKRELEIARAMQRDLLPRKPPVTKALDIADRSVPATEVGGDYFDYLALADGHLGVVLGDVAGHGMTAGLIMAMAKSAIHTQVRADGTPGLLMPRLGEVLFEMSASNQYMTMVFAQLDPAGRLLRYVNAGHHFPLHVRTGSGRVERLESTGPPLGLLPVPPGEPRSRDLAPGDVLAFYSDGLVEAFNAEDEEYGIDRLGALIAELAHQPASAIVDEAFRAVRRFTGDRSWHDDATLVVVRVLPE